MVKLTGAKKAAFLKRMEAGRKKALHRRAVRRSTILRNSPRKRRKTTKINTTTKRKSMARRKSYGRKVYRKSKSSFGSFLKGGLIGKAVAGIGAATLAGLVIGQVAPQYAGIAKPIAAFAAGGPAGAITSVVLDGGLSSFGSLFGGSVAAPEVGV